MTKEEKVGRLLSVEDGAVKISVLIPKILLDSLLAAYKDKVGATRNYGQKSSALFYFAARGVVDFEEERLSGEERSFSDGPAARITEPSRAAARKKSPR